MSWLIRAGPLLLLSLAGLPGGAAHGQCPEPSALDLAPAAEPLRVQKVEGGDVGLTWEEVRADGYRLHRGSLSRLAEEQTYDHRVVLETAVAEATLDPGASNAYFVVNADCRARDSGVGRDSQGRERPWGGLLVVRVGLQGGADVYGAQFTLLYPEGRAFTDADGPALIGPYAPGAPGSPFGTFNTNIDGQVRAIMLFLTDDPDPSFDPPSDVPLDVTEVFFGYHGTPPPVGELSTTDCVCTDSRGNLVAAVSCLISGYDLVF